VLLLTQAKPRWPRRCTHWGPYWGPAVGRPTKPIKLRKKGEELADREDSNSRSLPSEGSALSVSREEARAARKLRPPRVAVPHRAAATGQVIVDAILPARENLIGRLERLSERVDELAETAKVEGRDGIALAGLSEIRKTIADIGRIAGLDRPSIALQVNNSIGSTTDDLARTVLDLLRQELPPEKQVTLLPLLAGSLNSISTS
jgi:hypothetical protein